MELVDGEALAAQAPFQKVQARTSDIPCEASEHLLSLSMKLLAYSIDALIGTFQAWPGLLVCRSAQTDVKLDRRLEISACQWFKAGTLAEEVNWTGLSG